MVHFNEPLEVERWRGLLHSDFKTTSNKRADSSCMFASIGEVQKGEER